MSPTPTGAGHPGNAASRMMFIILKCRDHSLHHEQVRSHSNSVTSAKLNLNRLSGQRFKPGNFHPVYCCRMGSVELCRISGTFNVVPPHTLFL